MTNAIKKTPDANGIYQYVINVEATDYPTVDWEHDPVISNVSGVSTNHWKYDGTNTLVEMSQGEKDTVDTSVSMAVALSSDPIVHIYSDEQAYIAGETKTISLPETMDCMAVHVFDPAVQELTNGALVSAKGVGWDPGNVSTGEANINNGVFTDLVYNNSVSGNTSGVILGIDMGEATTVNAMKKYDYSATYFDTSWEFIGTNDATGATYTVIFSATQTSARLTPDPYFKAFSDQSFRYYGWRCVTSNNATYTIVTELELWTGTLLTVEKELVLGTDYSVMKLPDGTLSVTNMGDLRTLKTVILGK